MNEDYSVSAATETDAGGGRVKVKNSGRGVGLAVALMGLTLMSWMAGRAQTAHAALHTNPLNVDPAVRQAYEKFYNLDYDGALRIFDEVRRTHPQDPMATDYVLMATIFRELYRQDLLDTTYYAHDSFLTSKRAVSVSKETRDAIDTMTEAALDRCEELLKANPEDKNALFARGYARGMHAAFIVLVDHAYAGGAHQGLQSRSDSEAVLRIDPEYADAKMAIGIQQFAVASLPRFIRVMVGIMGVGGSKERGLQMLRDSAAKGVVTAVESRTTLSLFLRHDGRYGEALQVERALAQQYPHDYLFRLEVANLLKDKGEGMSAVHEYEAVLADAGKKSYFVEPRLQLAYFGLADSQRGQRMFKEAAENFTLAADQPNCSDWMRRRAALNAGEMLDAVHERERAMKMYEIAAAPGGDQSQAEAARRRMRTPYTPK